MKPEWYRRSERFDLPGTPSMNGVRRALNIMKGLKGKHPFGMFMWRVCNESDRRRLREWKEQGTAILIRMVPCGGNEFRAVLANTAKRLEKEREKKLERIAEIDELLKSN